VIARAHDLKRMDILILLVPLAVVLALLMGAGFWWAVASGQFEDLEGPAHRILADDDGAVAERACTTPAPAVLTAINSVPGDRL
jgi:cbb3-type cytochrome oxidase maturation protein